MDAMENPRAVQAPGIREIAGRQVAGKEYWQPGPADRAMEIYPLGQDKRLAGIEFKRQLS
ncbi:MAG: hypothetical protein Fur0032_15440 [Terrimicrobiaceae bacterium]